MNKEEIFEILEEATAAEIDEYLAAAINRKQELYPDWDICYLAMPKESPEEKRIFDEKMKKLMAVDTLRIFNEFMARKHMKLWERLHNGATVSEAEESLAIMEELMAQDLEDEE